MAETDYQRLYQDYWARADRWGSSSFEDPELLARTILTTCGGGRVLAVGCGMGVLVRALLMAGLDATGLDVAPACIEHGNATSPGRFVHGSILELPFDDDAFDVVVCTDVLEHLGEADVDRAISELVRVSRRGLYLTIATGPDRDRTWHLTIRDRLWWERKLLSLPVRRHPRMLAATPYETLEHEGPSATIVLERLPESAGSYTLDWLADERDLHMDMLREAGRRSDAHLARYALAAQMVRPGDVVLDVACGMGYGSTVLAQNSRAGSILGLDNSERAIEYARACHGGAGVEFDVADAIDLGRVPDRSVDLVVSFETIEHLAEPEVFLDEVVRVLRPSGRLIASVPNDWTDETGKDPNPNHLHVYDWQRLTAQIGSRLLLERAHAQTAGGGMKLGDQPRSIEPVSVHESPRTDAEWWLVTAMKDPVGERADDYRQTHFPGQDDLPGSNVTAFDRDYENPWLVEAIVSIGMRAEDPELLESLSRRVLEIARAGSADEGAALCVLAYRLLEANKPIDEVLDGLSAYDERAESTPHAWRWKISNRYVAGLLLMRAGRREEARAAFERCAELDPLRFSPLLATKTVGACHRGGLLWACDGQLDRATDCWKRGIELARKAVSADWTNVVGSTDAPLSFGLRELCQVLDQANQCALAILWAEHWQDRPGLAWEWATERAWLSQLRWLGRVQQAKDWLDRQRSIWADVARQRERTAEQLRETTTRQGTRLASLNEALASQAEQLHELRSWCSRVEASKQWLTEQRDSALELAEQRQRDREQIARECSQQVERMRDWVERQTQTRQWLEEQVKRLNEQRELNAQSKAQLQQRINGFKQTIEKLATARDWLAEQRQRQAETIEKLTAARDWLAEQQQRQAETIERLKETVASLKETIERLKSRVRSQDEQLLNRRAGDEKRLETLAWQKRQIEHLRQAIEARDRVIAGQKEHLARAGRSLEAKDTQIARLRDWTEKLVGTRDWLKGQVAGAKARAQATGDEAERLRRELDRARRAHESLLTRLDAELEGLSRRRFGLRRGMAALREMVRPSSQTPSDGEKR
jgi:ubiquinone/menaquinone biosynthesis C-methylase UbiE